MTVYVRGLKHICWVYVLKCTGKGLSVAECERGHGACKALMWAVRGLHAQYRLGGRHCAVRWASAKDNSKSNGNAVAVSTAQGRAVSLLQSFVLPPMPLSLSLFWGQERSSFHLPSDLPIPCLQRWREISTDENTQKKPAGANVGKSVTGGESSKVSWAWLSCRQGT